MKKYQESLNYISELAAWTRSDNDVEPHKYLLQELVDKETPMKPALLVSHKKPNKRQYQCLRCGNACLVRYAPFERNENRHCYNCGQAIDWSDNEA